MENEAMPTPIIPEALRTVLYVVGVFAAAAALATDGTLSAGLVALSGACNALAFGYRPTRPDAPS